MNLLDWGAEASMAMHSFKQAKTIDHRLVRMARAGLGLSVRELAERSRLNKATIVRLEAGVAVRESTLKAVRTTLEACGAEFIACSDSGLAAVAIAFMRDPNDELD